MGKHKTQTAGVFREGGGVERGLAWRSVITGIQLVCVNVQNDL